MARVRRIVAEVVASFALAWLAILFWHGILPLGGWVDRFILRPGPWGELLGVLFISATYYAMLCVIMALARRIGRNIHPIPTAYFGGWWLIVLLAFLGVFSPTFNVVFGLSVTTSGTNLIFITLFVGAAKYWMDGYLFPPPKAPDIEAERNAEDSDDRHS